MSPTAAPLLTIILTLKDRHKYTQRWLAWMNEQKCPFPIVIADGSTHEDTTEFLEQNQFEHLSLKYRRFPPDVSLDHWYRKLATAATLVETELVTHADNDDFFLIEQLKDAAQRMVEAGAVCYSRTQYRIRINERASSIEDHLVPQGEPVRLTKTPTSAGLRDLVARAPLERLEFVVKNFPSSYFWYGLHRAANLRRLHANVAHLSFHQAMFQEWYFQYACVLSGKVLIEDLTPFLVRQEQTSQGAASLYDSERLDRIFLYPDWSRSFVGMCDLLYEELGDQSRSLAAEDFQRLFREWFSIHLLQFNDGRLLRMRLAKYRSIVALGSHVLSWMKGKSPLLFKYEKLEGAGKDSELHALNRFLHAFQPAK